MADQKRWFKVWTSIVSNSRFAEMSLEDIGRWTLLGALTALDGDHGIVEVPGAGRRLCELLRVPDLDAARDALTRLGSLTVEEGQNRHGEFTVTWRNWIKYQEDSTASKRQKASRSKRRGEKRRRDEKRDPPLPPNANTEPTPNRTKYLAYMVDCRTRCPGAYEKELRDRGLDPGTDARADFERELAEISKPKEATH